MALQRRTSSGPGSGWALVRQMLANPRPANAPRPAGAPRPVGISSGPGAAYRPPPASPKPPAPTGMPVTSQLRAVDPGTVMRRLVGSGDEVTVNTSQGPRRVGTGTSVGGDATTMGAIAPGTGTQVPITGGLGAAGAVGAGPWNGQMGGTNYQLTGWAGDNGITGYGATQLVPDNPEWLLPSIFPGMGTNTPGYGVLSDLPFDPTNIVSILGTSQNGTFGMYPEDTTNALAQLYQNIGGGGWIDPGAVLGALFNPGSNSPLAHMMGSMSPSQQANFINGTVRQVAASSMNPMAAQGLLANLNNRQGMWGNQMLQTAPADMGMGTLFGNYLGGNINPQGNLQMPGVLGGGSFNPGMSATQTPVQQMGGGYVGPAGLQPMPGQNIDPRMLGRQGGGRY